VRRASELRLSCPAQSRYLAPIRHALAAFLEALAFDSNVRDDVTTAAGEALANVVEHAYVRSSEKAARDLQLLARMHSGGRLSVDVSDHGSFIRRKPLPGRGFGLRIIRAIARQMSIDTSRGTCVSMTFEMPSAASKR
jgi:anti-sigma regulatory factor (Ser/Thr protein kinase)